MKIDKSYVPPTAKLTSRPSSAVATSPAGTKEAVSLSTLAGSMQSSEKPPVNSARVQEIKEAISEGRFRINADAIADRLIESARDLISSKRQA
jgi:negative regulator of flagellin synthesis FlgM